MLSEELSQDFFCLREIAGRRKGTLQSGLLRLRVKEMRDATNGPNHRAQRVAHRVFSSIHQRTGLDFRDMFAKWQVSAPVCRNISQSLCECMMCVESLSISQCHLPQLVAV